MQDVSIELLALFFVLIVLIVFQIIVLVFNTQIKNFFEKHKHIKRPKKTIKEINYFINNLASSLARISYNKVGALIIIENKDNMNKYINSGKKVSVNMFPEFIFNIFYNHKSPLHDGAMIIRNLKIVSLSSYLPMTTKILPVNYGARHRAGFGICEHFDCYSFIVSETTGEITCAHLDQIKKLSNSPEELVNQIVKILSQDSIYSKILSR